MSAKKGNKKILKPRDKNQAQKSGNTSEDT